MYELINNLVTSQRVKNISKLKREVFIVLYLCDGKLKGNADYDCIGTKDFVPFPDTEIVIENCKRLNTNSILLMHNHPYRRGLETFFLKEYFHKPSIRDIASTRLFTDLVKRQGINVLDHIIVTGDGSYFSFVENYLM